MALREDANEPDLPEDDDLPLDEQEADGAGDEADEDDLPLDGEDDDEDPDEGGSPVNAHQPTSPPQQSRGERRFQALNDRVRAAEEAAAQARREAEELRRNTQAQEFQRQEQERLANMTPEERSNYELRVQVNHLQRSTWDTNDRVQFDGLCARNPAVADLKDEVEQVFRERMNAGQPVDRSTIATFLIGQKALSAAPRARAKGRRTEEQGRQRNQVRAPSSRGDVQRSGRTSLSEAEARRERLKDQLI